MVLNASMESVRPAREEEWTEAVCVRAVEYGGEALGRKPCKTFLEARDGCNFWNNYRKLQEKIGDSEQRNLLRVFLALMNGENVWVGGHTGQRADFF